MSMRRILSIAAVLAGVASLSSQVCLSASVDEPVKSSARMTPLVRVIQQAEPAIVSLFVISESGQIGAGSGTMIHPSGYVLTNNHVLPRDQGYALVGFGQPEAQQPLRFRVVGRYPERDLAIVRLQGSGPFATLPLGRSDDLMNGETIVVAGNPGGRGLVFTSGIVSAKSVLSGAPNALVMTSYKVDYRPRFIQFDAASNGGNSGGPLVNLDGQVIGVVSAKVNQEQNVGFAIPVDVVFQLIAELCESELHSGYCTGIHLKFEGGPAVIHTVDSESAAQACGLQPDDRIVAVNDLPVRHTVDWHLTLLSLLQQPRTIRLQIQRAGELLTVSLQPTATSPRKAADVDAAQLVPGLNGRLFPGKYSLLPAFQDLTAAEEFMTPTVSLEAVPSNPQEDFALQLHGFLKVEQDGLYRLVATSDDGSRVWLHDDMIIDNDGNHPPLGVGKWMHLQKGCHPLRVEYFQGNGGAELSLSWQWSDQPQQPVPATALWHTKTP